MESVGDVVLFGVSMVIMIPLVVEGFKGLGLPDKWVPWVTLGLSFLGAFASVVINLFPELQGPWYIAAYTVVSGLVLWLMVTGLYQVGRNVARLQRPPEAK